MRQHGTRTMYVNSKCRCEPCMTANRLYAREVERRQARIRYGIEQPDDKWVDPTEARDHLLWLTEQGIGLRTLMNVTGLGRTALTEIKRGIPKRIARTTAMKILATPNTHRPLATLVDAAATWQLLNDLLHLGFTKTRVATALGSRSGALQIQKTRVTLKTSQRVQTLYNHLIDETPIWHGTYAGSVKHHCKCLRCKATYKLYRHEQVARRREAAQQEPVTTNSP